MTSAESRLAAASKMIRVRVESSKKRFTTVVPTRVGSFRIARDWVSAMCSAVASTAAPRRGRGPAMEMKCLMPSSPRCLSGPVSAGGRCRPRRPRPSRSARRAHARCGRWGGSCRRESAPDRQLPVTAVHEHRQAHGGGPADRPEGVEGRTDGAAGVQHVVDEDDGAAVDTLGAGYGWGCGARVGFVPQVVAVHGDVEGPGELVQRAVVRPRHARSGRRGARRAALRGAGCPSSTRSSAPWPLSRISWAIRVSARRISSAPSTRECSAGESAESPAAVLLRILKMVVRHAWGSPFHASRDVSLKGADARSRARPSIAARASAARRRPPAGRRGGSALRTGPGDIPGARTVRTAGRAPPPGAAGVR